MQFIIYNVYFWQVKIWDDRRAVPLSVIKPHDGKAVYSVSFLTAPEQPSHINLVTAVYTLLHFHIFFTLFAVMVNQLQQPCYFAEKMNKHKTLF